MARDVSLLAVLEAVAGCDVVRGAGDGSAVTALVLRAGLTGVGGSAEGWDWREVRLAATGAEEVVLVVTELGVLVTAGVVTLAGVGVLLTAVALPEAASLALFSFLILSISSSSLAAAGRVGVTAGLGAAGLGAGGGVSFFLGRANSISLSFTLNNIGGVK